MRSARVLSDLASMRRAFPTQPPINASQLQQANMFFAKPATFIQSISQADQAPPLQRPEIAFVGRSNVGKSTLINQILNRRRLVKTSKNPGHTRLLNFFNVNDQLTLVDMPGYGFGSRQEWGQLVLDYLSTRKQLRRLFLLIDPTAGIKSTDVTMMQMLDERAIVYQTILTKADRLSPGDFETKKAEVEQFLVDHAVCCYPQLLWSEKPRKGRIDHASVQANLAYIRWSMLNAAGLLS